MSKIFICSAKLGDQINLLPLLWKDSQDGARPTLIVGKEYAGQLSEGCSYFDELVFDGDPLDVKAAFEFAKKHADEKDIVVAQIPCKLDQTNWAHSRLNLTSPQTDSFAKESYFLAGRLAEFGRYPLVFDRRDANREAELTAFLHGNTKPVMLVSTGGVTSPFQHKEALFEVLSLKFPAWKIVDLSTIKAHRIYDLLGLYEKAHMLVATDSAPLHLAYACQKLPVVALVNDKPLFWHGSPWRPNHIAHVRYMDFKARILDIWNAISNVHAPGSRFDPVLKGGSRLIHVWHNYELSDETKHLEARKTWKMEYAGHSWIECAASPGTFGKDSKVSQISEKRFPFLKDMIRMGARRARDEDTLVLTRPDTAFNLGITGKILSRSPCYAHRKAIGNDDFNPAVDLIAFPKTWWRRNHDKIPDLIWNNDQNWSSVLVELLKSTGAKELKDAVYQV